jgi:hypothetical protein
VALRCTEACRLEVEIAGRRVRRRGLAAGRRIVVRLPRRGRVVMRARDAAGNERVRRYSVPSGASSSRSPL